MRGGKSVKIHFLGGITRRFEDCPTAPSKITKSPLIYWMLYQPRSVFGQKHDSLYDILTEYRFRRISLQTPKQSELPVSIGLKVHLAEKSFSVCVLKFGKSCRLCPFSWLAVTYIKWISASNSVVVTNQ